MSRTPRLLAAATLAALLVAAAPAAAAPSGWSLFATFSPFDWIRHFWAGEGAEISPWGRPVPAAGGVSQGEPRGLWAEEGTSISPWGLAGPASRDGGSDARP